MSLRGPAPLTVVQLPGEQVQVQGVIQTAQSSSVIHSPQVQTVQVTTECLLNNQESCFMDVKRLVRACLTRLTATVQPFWPRCKGQRATSDGILGIHPEFLRLNS